MLPCFTGAERMWPGSCFANEPCVSEPFWVAHLNVGVRCTSLFSLQPPGLSQPARARPYFLKRIEQNPQWSFFLLLLDFCQFFLNPPFKFQVTKQKLMIKRLCLSVHSSQNGLAKVNESMHPNLHPFFVKTNLFKCVLSYLFLEEPWAAPSCMLASWAANS